MLSGVGSSVTQGRSCPGHPESHTLWEGQHIPERGQTASPSLPPSPYSSAPCLLWGLLLFHHFICLHSSTEALSHVPLSFKPHNPPPVSPWWCPQPVLSFCRKNRAWLAGFYPQSCWLRDLCPGCAVGHQRCPPADKLCWMGTEMTERSSAMLGSRYHSSLMFLLKPDCQKAWCSFGNFLQSCGKSVLHPSSLQWKESGHKGP